VVALNFRGVPVVGETAPFTGMPNGTHTLPASTRAVLILRNTHASNASTATITVPGTQYGQARPDIGPVSLPAGGAPVVFGGLVSDLADPGDGLIDVVTAGTGTPEGVAYEV
jgi:hypothetical protein